MRAREKATMRSPLVYGAAACILFAAVGSLAGEQVPERRLGPQMPRAAEDGLFAVCPPGSLPDRDVCVRIPSGDDPGGDELVALPGIHFDKKGRLRAYDQIPRRPDRPADYTAYAYPVAASPTGRSVGSGYDLDRPDSEQRRGRGLSHVGHGGVDLAAARGSEVHVIRLDHQEGDAEVVFVGKLFGNTVVTRHALREGGALREYVVLYGHLEAPAPGLAGGRTLADDSLVGYVGDSGSDGIVHLHLEVRQVRKGVEVGKLAAERLVANEATIVCDPRNVLPLAR
jgi:murein DD-endopeptidase MepM/ murein hydrolase activator NlpD